MLSRKNADIAAKRQTLLGNRPAVSYTHLDVYKRQGPTGYEVKDHKWVTNEKATMIYDLFDTYIKTGSRQAAREMLARKYDYDCEPSTVSHFLSQKCYTGEYKGCLLYTSRCV